MRITGEEAVTKQIYKDSEKIRLVFARIAFSYTRKCRQKFISQNICRLLATDMFALIRIALRWNKRRNLMAARLSI